MRSHGGSVASVEELPDSPPEMQIENVELSHLDDVQVIEAKGKEAVAVETGGEHCAHCSRPGSVAAMVNYGCKSHPKYRCKACHAAVRALERSARSKGEAAYHLFSEHRRQRPKRFNDLVMQIRLSPDGEAPLQDGSEGLPKPSGCSSLADRKDSIAKVVSTIFSEQGAEEYEEMRWMTERQFKSHMKLHEDMSAQEAQAEWDKAIISTEIEKRMKKGQTQVSVYLWDCVKHFRRKGSRRSFAQEEAMSDEELDGESGRKRLRLHVDTDENADVYSAGVSTVQRAMVAPPPSKAANGAKTVSALLGDLVGKATPSTDGSSVSSVETKDAETLQLLSDEDLKHMGLTKARGAACVRNQIVNGMSEV